MIPPFDAADAGLRIARVLQAGKIDYAVGGALALGAHGVPRGTLDVDVNVFVEEDRLPHVIETLSTLGIELHEDAAIARARRDGMFVGQSVSAGARAAAGSCAAGPGAAGTGPLA